ncbi:MAG: glycosyltransferase family 2 protein [Chitinophagaceae bacterium]|nr:glycosyltransferase family 2 protein [Chitinophagaceae bacterium]
MENRPKVSFCFTTFMRYEILRKTLESVSNQTFSDFEVIVSDNDPKQSGRAIVESFDKRFKYFPNVENLGMIKSFNKSLERSSGEFIVMIADDDPVYPDMLQTLLGLSNEYPGYGMYLGGCDWYCTSHEIGKLYNFNVGTNSCLSNKYDLDHIDFFGPAKFLKKLFSFEIFPHYLWSTCIVKRNILEKLGGVPEYGTPFLGDYAYISAIGSDSGCVIINRSLGQQTLHKENFGRNQNEEIAVAAKNFPEYLEGKASHLKEWPEIKIRVLRFTALWVINHLAFLRNYFKKTGHSDNSLSAAEKSVFAISYIKKFRTKYLLKKKAPLLHDFIVKTKSKLS